MITKWIHIYLKLVNGDGKTVNIQVHEWNSLFFYPNILWSWGAPKRPWFQLSGCFHWEGEISSPSNWFTALAMRAASPRLSPSRTNCRIQATATDDGSMSEHRIRRVSPPPGTRGITFRLDASFEKDVESGNSYIGSWLTPARSPGFANSSNWSRLACFWNHTVFSGGLYKSIWSWRCSSGHYRDSLSYSHWTRTS